MDVSSFRTIIASFITIHFKDDLDIKQGDTLIIEQDRQGATKAYLVKREGSDVHGSQK